MFISLFIFISVFVLIVNSRLGCQRFLHKNIEKKTVMFFEKNYETKLAGQAVQGLIN